MRVAIWLTGLMLLASPIRADNLDGRLPRVLLNPPKIVVRLVDARCETAEFADEVVTCTGALNYIQWPNEKRASFGIEVQVHSGARYFMTFDGVWDSSPANAEQLNVHIQKLRTRVAGPQLPEERAANGTCTVMQTTDQSFVTSITCDAQAGGQTFKVRLGSGSARIV